MHFPVVADVGDELLRFAARRTVADRDGLYIIGSDQLGHLGGRLASLVLGWMRVDRLIMQEIALRVEADQLATRTEAGIDSQDSFLSQRGRQEQLPEVTGEDSDRLLVGLLFASLGELGLDGGLEQTLESVVDSGLDQP